MILSENIRLFLACESVRPAFGGISSSVLGLTRALSHKGLSVGLWTADNSASEVEFRGRDKAIRVLNGTLKQAFSSFGNPSLVHDNGLWSYNHHQLAAICRRRSICRVVSVHGMLEPWARRHKWLKKRIAWLLYQCRDLKSANSLHATSDIEAGTLRSLCSNARIFVVPNGIELFTEEGHDTGEAKGDRTAIFLGRLYPVKGLPMLLECWGRVRPKGWRLQIAGPDEAGHRGLLEKIIKSQGLANEVEFLGPLGERQKNDALRNASLFVFPSYSENFGIAIAEAMAQGLPVLTTTGTPWPAVNEHRLGWRVAPTVVAFSDALRIATTTDVAELKATGQRAKTFAVSRYSWAEIGRQMLSQYLDLINR